MNVILANLTLVALGVLIAVIFSKAGDFGMAARRERDAAIESLRELLASRTARGLDDKASAREARAWARATAVLKAAAYRRGETPPQRPAGTNPPPAGARPAAPPPAPSRDRHVR